MPKRAVFRVAPFHSGQSEREPSIGGIYFLPLVFFDWVVPLFEPAFADETTTTADV